MTTQPLTYDYGPNADQTMDAMGGGFREEDPLTRRDPWGTSAQASSGGAPSPSSYPRPGAFSRRMGDVHQQAYPHEAARVFTAATAAIEPPAQRIIHDVPPTWDGKDPDNQAEPFLKLLSGWLTTTRTQKMQRGMTILHYASGDLKLIIT